jgi:hypothetical protein
MENLWICIGWSIFTIIFAIVLPLGEEDLKWTLLLNPMVIFFLFGQIFLLFYSPLAAIIGFVIAAYFLWKIVNE